MEGTSPKPKALVVDDELSVCKSCEKILLRKGYEVRYALSGREALSLLAEEAFDLVFTDLKMAEMGGMELLETLRIRYPDIVPVAITGYATVASVVETMKTGAFDYLPKPFTPDEMAAVAKRAWEKRLLLLEHRVASEGEPVSEFSGLIGKSPKMQEVYRLIRKVAPTSSTVLILGESGTGKELVARAVHDQSPRKEERFFAVDSGTLQSNLLESELFGHVKGAFTGAVSAKQGIFEAADRGTVFLDEICNVSLEVQSKLLRFIQERESLPVGGTEPRQVDVRLIFATNRNLDKMVAEGAFRQDLYYRLYVFPIHLPPLRERREDIPLLAYRFLKKAGERSEKNVRKISESALSLLGDYPWQGNVRQLENAIERAVIACDGDEIEPRHLPQDVVGGGLQSDLPLPRTNQELLAMRRRVRVQAIAALEKAFITSALERNSWNVTRASKEVGMQRSNFQALMRKYHIKGATGQEPRAEDA